MRTKLTLLGLMIFFGISAQNNKRFNLQFDFGVNLAIPYKRTIEKMPELERNPETHYKTDFGYVAEFIACYNFSDNIGLESGLNYTLNQIQIVDKIGLLESKGYIRTSYLNIPVRIKYKRSDSSPISIAAGFYAGILLKASEKGTTILDTAGMFEIGDVTEPKPIINPVKEYDNNLLANYADFDFGLSAQLDYSLILSDRFSSIVFTRLNYGLMDVISNVEYMNSLAEKWKNISLMIGLGIKF